jgi:hypothetical protein
MVRRKGLRMNRNDKPEIKFTGGSGDSPKNAVVIQNVENHRAGVAAEYLYLQQNFGVRDLDWRLVMQALLEGDRPLDRVTIELADGTQKDVYFDVSEFFGKG